MTLREWLTIVSDLDDYLLKGGKLLDVELHDLERLPPAVQTVINNALGQENVRRLGRFFRAVSDVARPDQTIGSTFTEDELKSIWRSTDPKYEKNAGPMH